MCKILAVDDERLLLAKLVKTIKDVEPDCEIFDFSVATEALDFVKGKSENLEIAFLDIEMRGGLSGLQLGKVLTEYYPNINIIYVTGYSQYAINAFDMHASGYILKPVTREGVLKELNSLRYSLDNQLEKVIKVTCFGNFEVFSNDVPVKFERKKTKELLAYLVDRKGSSVSNGELCSVLWEEKSDTESLKSQLRNLISDLTRGLRHVGEERCL